jgi:hypothetical protein
MEPEVTGQAQPSLVVFATECRKDPLCRSKPMPLAGTASPGSGIE